MENKLKGERFTASNNIRRDLQQFWDTQNPDIIEKTLLRIYNDHRVEVAPNPDESNNSYYIQYRREKEIDE